MFDCFCSHSYRRVIQLVRTKDAGRRAGEHYLVQTQEGAFYCNIRHQRYHIIWTNETFWLRRFLFWMFTQGTTDVTSQASRNFASLSENFDVIFSSFKNILCFLNSEKKRRYRVWHFCKNVSKLTRVSGFERK